MEDALTFGTWLKRRRGGLGLTQKDLANQIGYAEVSLRKVEADEARPSRQMAEKLAEALEIREEERTRFVRFARQQSAWAEAALPDRELSLPATDVRKLQVATTATEPVEHPPQLKLITASKQIDWGEAPDVSRFHGRQSEVEQLRGWLAADQCRLVAVLGMGGIGKTALATLVAASVQENYSAVIWRSLRNAPPLAELLRQCIHVLSRQEELELPREVDQRVALLMEYLRGQRCLLVLDNFETVLAGEQPGHYLPGFEDYGELLKQVGEGRHQSCLLLTSREKPRELIPLAGESAPVRTLAVGSMEPADGRAVLQDRGLRGSDAEWVALHARYSGNPLALQIVAETIRELFDGDIARFLAHETIVFGGVADLLEQQRARLSPLEQEVMFWLAVEREPVTPEVLSSDLVQRPSPQALLEALHDLRRRSLVESTHAGFTLQTVVLEYFIGALIAQMAAEISTDATALLQRFALLKATAKSYVRESQRNLILAPIGERVVEHMGRVELKEQFSVLLSHLRRTQLGQPGYAAGNLLNLMVHLGIELHGQDFSQLAVWQADLRNVATHDVDFRLADLAQSVFTDKFDRVLSVAFSLDGQRLAAGTMGNEIRVWRASDGEPLLTWVAHPGFVRSVCFSPDGSILASGGEKVVRLWDARDGRRVVTLQGHTHDVLSVRFSPDGNVLASGSGDRTVRLWDRHTGECLHTMCGHTGWVRSVYFCPDGNVLVSGSEDGTVRLWDRHTGQCLQTLQGHSDWIWSVSVSPDGQVLASGSEDRTVRLWNRHTGQCLYTLDEHANAIRSVCFSPDGDILVSGSDDQTVRLWDRRTGQCLHLLQGHTDYVTSVSFSPVGNILASGGDDKTIRLWDNRTGKCLSVLQGHTDCVWSVCFSLDSNMLASGSDDPAVRLWDSRTGECLHMLQGHTDSVRTVSFSPDGQVLASGSSDHTLRLWDRHCGQGVGVLQGHTGKVRTVCFSSDGNILASGSDDQTVRLWDPHTGKCLFTLRGHTGGLLTIGFSLDGNVLASAGDDPAVRLWNPHTGKCLFTLRGHTSWVWSICFSHDGNVLASGSDDHTVRLWDIHTGQSLHLLQGHTDSITSICLSPDGSILASGSNDVTVRLWDRHTGECLHLLQGHIDWVWCVCFSPDGSVLASGSADHTVRLWNGHTGDCLRVLQGHTNAVTSVCYSPDGSLLVSTGDDETIRFWDVQTGMCLRVLRSERPYERMNITEATSLTPAQIATLKRLGAVDDLDKQNADAAEIA